MHPRRALRRRGGADHVASRIEELVITNSIMPTEAVQAAPNIRVCGSPT